MEINGFQINTKMNKGTYYFPRNRTYQPQITGSGGGGGGGGTGSFCLPTYTGINITGSDYTMPGEGVYLISNNDSTHYMNFPNPTTNNGRTVIIIPGSTTTVLTSGSIYGGFSSIVSGYIYSFIAVSGSWLPEYI